jgi:hypothetical protein
MATAFQRNRIGVTPTRSDSPLNGFIFYAINPRPFSHRVGFSVDCYHSVVGYVVLLGGHINPHTIFRAIIFAIVDPINTQPFSVPIE